MSLRKLLPPSWMLLICISVITTMAICLSSCATSSTFIKSASVSGPAQKYVIRITDAPETEHFTLRLQYIENLDREIRTSASEVNSVYSDEPLDPAFELIDNVLWQLPRREFFLDMEAPLSEVIVLFGGLNFGAMGGETAIGKYIGLGFRKGTGDLRVRMDFSYNIQDIVYEVAYVNQTEYYGGDRDTTILYDQGKFASKHIGIGITLNTAFKAWPLNPFIHGGIGSQQLLQSKETSLFPDPPSYSDDYFNLTGGFFIYIGGNHRLLIGYGLNRHSNDNGKAPWTSNLILQTDFVF
jgi:hypothetical protein